jgi:hypothetical protein
MLKLGPVTRRMASAVMKYGLAVLCVVAATGGLTRGRSRSPFSRQAERVLG